MSVMCVCVSVMCVRAFVCVCLHRPLNSALEVDADFDTTGVLVRACVCLHTRVCECMCVICV